MEQATTISEHPDYVRFVELLLAHSRRLDTLTNALRPPLGINESHMLSLVAQKGQTTAVQICKSLGLEKSGASRHLSTLQNRGVIETVSSAEDRRFKLVRLSPQGERLLTEDNEIRVRQVNEYASALSAPEQNEFCRKLRALADALGAEDIRQQPKEIPLQIQIRRLTRAMGFLGENTLDTSYSIEQLQILYLTGLTNEGLLVTELKEQLPYDPSMLSRLYASLEERGLLVRVAIERDRRQIGLQLTEDGKAARARALRSAVLFVKSACESISSNFVGEILPLLEKIAEAAPAHRVVPLGRGWGALLLQHAEQRAEARGFLMENLVRMNLQYESPEVLIGSRHLCVGLYCGPAIKGIIEIVPGKSQWEVLHFVLSAEVTEEEMIFLFFRNALASAFRKESCREVVTYSFLAHTVLSPYLQPDSSGALVIKRTDLERLFSTQGTAVNG